MLDSVARAGFSLR